MENKIEKEIEIKVMCLPENIAFIIQWITTLNILLFQKNILINTYYDTPDRYFANQKMGLRVRTKNHDYEMTLKTQGNIIGGLHIRPEYNLTLSSPIPDIKRLVSHFNLQMPDVELIQHNLVEIFSTNFTRQSWFIQCQHSQIEIALDQGMIKNQYGEEAICELEFELKRGDTADLIALLEQMPRKTGMWLSTLSKAQRGYLIGNPSAITEQIAKLTACEDKFSSEIEQYQFEQKVADFIRITQNKDLIRLMNKENIQISDLTSEKYLNENIAKIKTFL